MASRQLSSALVSFIFSRILYVSIVPRSKQLAQDLQSTLGKCSGASQWTAWASALTMLVPSTKPRKGAFVECSGALLHTAWEAVLVVLASSVKSQLEGQFRQLFGHFSAHYLGMGV